MSDCAATIGSGVATRPTLGCEPAVRSGRKLLTLSCSPHSVAHSFAPLAALNDSAGLWQITRETLRHAHSVRKDQQDYSLLPEHLRPPETLDVQQVRPQVLTDVRSNSVARRAPVRRLRAERRGPRATSRRTASSPERRDRCRMTWLRRPWHARCLCTYGVETIEHAADQTM